ncbi:MAG TPA: DUF1080 domain-containing protein [Candidatus Acidoferrales bacterium]|nr:DUF1080 domain-containing protein [Candidatus Acidoferrales bacterium]
MNFRHTICFPSARLCLDVCLDVCLALCLAATLLAQSKKASPGYTDTPILPGQRWHVHDSNRPHPNPVTPGKILGEAPSDAIVLFDGHDLSRWMQNPGGKPVDARWKVVENGYFECVPRSGDLLTRDKFGDVQLHIEWSEPTDVKGTSQERGNSGVLLMDRYEIQVLDSYNDLTYADGQAGALYGQWPPLVNPIRKPGEWQAYDIVFEAPKFDGEKLVRPAFATVFFNGVLVHHRKEILGTMVHRQVARYTPHGAEEPLALQDHGNPVRYRNVWLRRLNGYDQPER